MENGRKLFDISKKEEEIIWIYMFLLGRIPKCPAGWIVVLADKICTVVEYCSVSIIPSAVC